MSRSTDDPFDDPSDRREDRLGADSGPTDPARTDGSPEAPASRIPDESPRESTRESTPVTQQLGRVVMVLLAMLFGIFAVANSHRVDFSWVFGETQARPGGTGGVPLIVLLLVAFVMGVVVGVLATRQFRRGHRHSDGD